MSMHTDALIVGAGPAGLSLAISLAQAGFQVTVLEQQPLQALQQPQHPPQQVLRPLLR